MPWVALAAFVLNVLGTVAPSLGGLAGLLAFLTVVYYLPAAIRWTWRKVFWRVRRRLAITYLFVGVAPIALLLMLVGLASWGISAEATARAVTGVMAGLEEQIAAGSTASAARFAALPASQRGDPAAVRRWLDQEAAALAGVMPGPVLYLWPSSEGPPLVAPAPVQGEPPGPAARFATPLPGWLASRPGWRGLAGLPDGGETEDRRPGAGLLGAVARAGDEAAGPLLMAALPIDRPLVEHLGRATGIRLHPFVALDSVTSDDRGVRVQLGRGTRDGEDAIDDAGAPRRRLVDQFGEEGPEVPYVVVAEVIDWRDGSSDTTVAFLFDWSATAAVTRMLKTGPLAGGWQVALTALGVFFLMVEAAALILAILITREVTGTVHELDHGTDLILAGDFAHRIRPRSSDQLGQLAEHFNEMSARIEGLLEERVARERLEQELRIAAQVQSQLFPRSAPVLARAELAGECRAARGVAGDYYDYIELAPGLVALALGDVSGKGISASLVMSNLQAALRMQTTLMMESDAPRAGDGALTSLAGRINRQLCSSIQANRFATIFLGLFDDATGRIRYINAGHNAPVLAHADGRIERLTEGGMIVGIMEGARYREGHATLAPGSALVVFSDGISEAEDPADELYGEERLARFVAARRGMGAVALRDALFEEIDRWMAGRDRGDDQTVVVLKVPE